MGQPTKAELSDICIRAAIIALSQGATKEAMQFAKRGNDILKEQPTEKTDDQK